MLISVIIPTRERARYLQHSLQTALDIKDDDIEIIVSDNASQDGTPDLLAGVSDPRLRAIRTDGRLSMRQNFQFALDHARGDYIIYFGDDDGILPGQFPTLRRILEDRRPDGLSWSMPTYAWPEQKDLKSKTGVRFRKKDMFGGIEEFDIQERLRAIEACDLRNFTYIPRIYHGAASRDYLDRAANKDGIFFCGSIPDIYFCYRACQTGGNFLYSRHPFSINGFGRASTGGSQSSSANSDTSDSPAKRFEKETEEDPLRDVLPSKQSVSLVIFSTLETIRHRFPEPELHPDYSAWCNWVLRDANSKAPELRDAILKVLDDYAAANGFAEILRTADTVPPASKKKLPDRWQQLKGNIQSMKLSSDIAGENTIYTATQIADRVLSDNYGRVLAGQMTPDQAWKALKVQSRGIKRLW